MEEVFCVLIQPVACLRIDMFGRPGRAARRDIQIAFGLEVSRGRIGRLHGGHWSGMGPRCHPFLSLHPVPSLTVEPIELVSGPQRKGRNASKRPSVSECRGGSRSRGLGVSSSRRVWRALRDQLAPVRVPINLACILSARCLRDSSPGLAATRWFT